MVRLINNLDLRSLKKINKKFVMKCPFENNEYTLFLLERNFNTFYCFNCERSGEIKIPPLKLLNNIVKFNKLSS